MNIWGKYQGKIEKLDETSKTDSASFLVREYSMAFGKDWVIWAGRKSDDPTKKEKQEKSNGRF